MSTRYLLIFVSVLAFVVLALVEISHRSGKAALHIEERADGAGDLYPEIVVNCFACLTVRRRFVLQHASAEEQTAWRDYMAAKGQLSSIDGKQMALVKASGATKLLMSIALLGRNKPRYSTDRDVDLRMLRSASSRF